MESDEFLNRLQSEMPGEHRVRGSMGSAESGRLKPAHLAIQLPVDLEAFLRTTNGIDFRVCDVSPSGYFRLLPIDEIDSARERMWGSESVGMEVDDLPMAHWLAITEHDDGAYYIVLDPDTQTYYFMDSCGADLTCPAGGSLYELLDSIWAQWIEPHKTVGDISR